MSNRWKMGPLRKSFLNPLTITLIYGLVGSLVEIRGLYQE